MASALSLEFEETTTKRQLLALIKSRMEVHKHELAATARFQGLYIYRKGAGGVTGRAGTKETGKTSADKAAEDLKAAEKGQLSPSGAYKQLIDQKVTVDPPACFEPLESAVKACPPEGIDSSSRLSPPRSISDRSSASSYLPDVKSDARTHPRTPSPSPRSIEDVSQKMGTLRTPTKGEQAEYRGKPIIVTVRDYHNRDLNAQEVLVETGRTVHVTTSCVRGEYKPCVKLSELLPALIQNSSPVKNNGSRFYRPGVTNPDSRMAVGSVDVLMKGEKPRELKAATIDTYPLEYENEDDMLACEVILEYRAKEDGRRIAGSAATLPSGSAATTSPTKKRVTGTSLPPGAGQRADRDALKKLLLDVLGNPQTSWGKADTAGMMLKRLHVVDAALSDLKDLGWVKRNGGYQIPHDHDNTQLAGQTFTKEDVCAILNVGHTSHNDDRRLFNPKTLARIPVLARWVSNPDGHEFKRYAAMSRPELQRYQQRKLNQKSAGSAPTQPQGNSRKRTDHAGSSNSEVHRKKRPRTDSSDLESDDMDLS